MVGVENVHLRSAVSTCSGMVGITPFLPDTHNLLEVRRVPIDTNKPPPPALFRRGILGLLSQPILHRLYLALQFLDAFLKCVDCHWRRLPSVALPVFYHTAI